MPILSKNLESLQKLHRHPDSRSDLSLGETFLQIMCTSAPLFLLSFWILSCCNNDNFEETRDQVIRFDVTHSFFFSIQRKRGWTLLSSKSGAFVTTY